MFSYNLGEGAELRLFEPRYAADFLRLAQENRAYFGRWLSWVDDVNNIEDARRFMQEDADQFAKNGLAGMGLWLDGELVGGVYFFPIEQRIRATKIAYFLAEKASGKGLMTKAVRAALKYVFEDLKLNRVGLEAEPGNERSNRMAERLGFQFEGIRRDGWRNEDGFVDIGVYSMLASDWRRLNAK